MKKLTWLKKRPFLMLNVAFIMLFVSLFFYQLLRPLDVLVDWDMQLAPAKTYKVMDGTRYAVFHPNETFIFISQSEKVSTASGDISRSLVCDATTELDEREILLDVIPANREIGVSPARASSIVLPDVVQFNRLPRVCRLVIYITYTNVALWRAHTEHAETEKFIVEETSMSPAEARKQIEELNKRILELEEQIGSSPESVTQSNTKVLPSTSQPTRSNQPPRQQPARPQPSRPSTPVETPDEPVQERPGLIRGLLNAGNTIIDTTDRLIDSLIRR